MHQRWKAWAAGWLLLPLVGVLMLLAGCGRSQPTPAQAEKPTATHPAAPTATEAATATQVATATTAPTNTPQIPTESTTDVAGPGDEAVVYALPVKGDESAPVTIIEFSDYL